MTLRSLQILVIALLVQLSMLHTQVAEGKHFSRLNHLPYIGKFHTELDRASGSSVEAKGTDYFVPLHSPLKTKFAPDVLQQREINLGLIMLFFYGTIGSLLPYLPVYYRRLGLGGIKKCVFI